MCSYWKTNCYSVFEVQGHKLANHTKKWNNFGEVVPALKALLLILAG